MSARSSVGRSSVGGDGGGAAALDGELSNFGDAIPPLMGAGDYGDERHGADGGAQCVVEGSQVIHTADEAEMPLVGEIRLNLGRNFRHFFPGVFGEAFGGGVDKLQTGCLLYYFL